MDNSFLSKSKNDPTVVVINGIGCAGKDTFVTFVGQIIGSGIYTGVRNISTINNIRGAASVLGWNYDKTDNGRWFLSELKKLSKQYNDFPYRSVCKILDEKQYKICFVHCREPEEIDRFVKDYNAITLLIRRPGIDIPQNESDMNVENYNYDYIVYNNGTLDDLKIKAETFVRWLGYGDLINKNGGDNN